MNITSCPGHMFVDQFTLTYPDPFPMGEKPRAFTASSAAVRFSSAAAAICGGRAARPAWWSPAVSRLNNQSMSETWHETLGVPQPIISLYPYGRHGDQHIYIYVYIYITMIYLNCKYTACLSISQPNISCFSTLVLVWSKKNLNISESSSYQYPCIFDIVTSNEQLTCGDCAIKDRWAPA